MVTKKSIISSLILSLVFCGMNPGLTKAFAKHKAKNPLPFRPTSYYLNVLKERLERDQKDGSKIGKEEKNEEKSDEDLEALLGKDYANAHSSSGDRLEKFFPDEVVKMCMEYLDHNDPVYRALDCPMVAMKNVLNKKILDNKKIPFVEKVFLAELDRQFVKVPEGALPARTAGAAKIPVEAFDTTRYPVTRALWKEVMGDMPAGVPEDEKQSWDSCPDCPVTYVLDKDYKRDEKGQPVKDGHGRDQIVAGDIQTFLERLNKRAEVTGCKYKLPSYDQLLYSIRADVTGDNKDEYSKGVTRENVNDYVTHRDNSGGQIQPVGQKKLNEFGIELGNIKKMSTDVYDETDPSSGCSRCGAHWNSDVSFGASKRHGTYVGFRYAIDGFDLVRICTH